MLCDKVLDHIRNGQQNPRKALKRAQKDIIEAVMEYRRYNQSKAAMDMGVSRGTFRKLLVELFGTKYIGNPGNE